MAGGKGCGDRAWAAMPSQPPFGFPTVGPFMTGDRQEGQRVRVCWGRQAKETLADT